MGDPVARTLRLGNRDDIRQALHLLIETQTPTLSKGMKLLNGTYTQYFNRQHHRVGHVFQGRFKAILAQKDSHLLELARYIVLNPVRAQMVRSAKEWRWSSPAPKLGAGCNGRIQSAPCLFNHRMDTRRI